LSYASAQERIYTSALSELQVKISKKIFHNFSQFPQPTPHNPKNFRKSLLNRQIFS